MCAFYRHSASPGKLWLDRRLFSHPVPLSPKAKLSGAERIPHLTTFVVATLLTRFGRARSNITSVAAFDFKDFGRQIADPGWAESSAANANRR
jgi:hypothetical protein